MKRESGNTSGSDSRWLAERRPGFRDLVAAIDDYAIFSLNRNGTILDWNSGAEKITGFSGEEAVGRDFASFFTQDDRDSGLPGSVLAVAARDGYYATEGWRLRKGGALFWAHATVTALRSPAGELEGFIKVTRDLTERKNTMEELLRSETRFRLLVESVQDTAIFLLDPEGHIISWNCGAKRIKGYEQEEIIGRHFSVFYPRQAVEAGVPADILRTALRDGRAQLEGWRIRKDGTRFWGNVTITPLFGKEGDLEGFAKVTRDLSVPKQVESLRESGRRKDAFLATLAHELRNPLAPILPGLDLILGAPDDTEAVTKVAGMMRRQVDQLARLIDDLVDVSRISSGKYKLRKSSVLFADVLERSLEAVSPLIVAKHHELRVDFDIPSLRVFADSHRLSQVVSNLLSNAAKYTPDGGRIGLGIVTESPDILVIRVEDNGIGIPKKFQETIFELFDQGSNGENDGLGIGLTLVRSIVEMHGGTIELHSDGACRGSRFVLRLPVVSSGTEVAAAAPSGEGGAKGAGNVIKALVADDGRTTADVMGMFLRMEGLESHVAYDGDEALRIAKEERPDVVFLDLGMPRMDGFTACRKIREVLPDAFVFALSGWGGKEDRRRTADAGFDEHLVKPVAPDDIRELLGRYLNRPEPSDG